MSGLNEETLQVVKKHRAIRPYVSLLPLSQSFPLLLSIESLAKYAFPGVFTQKHLTNDWFYSPKAALVPKIHTLEANIWELKGLHEPVNLIIRRHQDIDYYISKKSGNPFTATTCAVAILITLMSTNFRKMPFQESICLFSESEVASYPSPKP
jgi:hypothetical protein